MSGNVSPHGRSIRVAEQRCELRLTLGALAGISQILDARGPQDLALIWRSKSEADTIKTARTLLLALLRPSFSGQADALAAKATVNELNHATLIMADLFEEAFQYG